MSGFAFYVSVIILFLIITTLPNVEYSFLRLCSPLLSFTLSESFSFPITIRFGVIVDIRCVQGNMLLRVLVDGEFETSSAHAVPYKGADYQEDDDKDESGGSSVVVSYEN